MSLEARYLRGDGLFAIHKPGFEPGGVQIMLPSQGQWAKNGKYEYCYHFGNSDFMPSEGDLDVKTSFIGRVAGDYQLSTWTYVVARADVV